MDTVSASHAKDALGMSYSVSTVKPSQVTSCKSVTGVVKTSKKSEAATVGNAVSVQSAGRKAEGTGMPDSSLSRHRSTLMKPTLSSSASLQKRNSTGSIRDKQAVATVNRTSVDGKKISPSVSDSGKKSSLGSRRSLLLSDSSKDLTPDTLLNGKKASACTVLSLTSDTGKTGSMRTLSSRSLESVSSSRRLASSLECSNRINSIKKATSNGSSSLERSSSSISATRVSSVAGRKKTSSSAESCDSRFIMLPQVDVKARDDLRLDLRGHKIRSLDAPGLNLSPSLEFVYLRDNFISSVVGVEILKRVKVLDLSFNDFKAPNFEPLGSCKALQQLYLAGNQITTLSSLPELPNLEFLSVAQNKLKSLAMSSQPKLQVLAASKNKISTLKGFPLLPVLEHLRVEENPILRVSHVEAASILLIGPTLKKFNDRDLSLKELEIAKSYPAHTPICIRDGWEFCHPELAADSSFSFLLEKWKGHVPPGFMLKESSIDPPFEDDICWCHFNFINLSSDSELVLKYQWFVGEKTPTNFEIIADAVGEVYWPKRGDIGKFLKVECTPILLEVVYPPVFAISSPVSPGTGCPKVLSLSVHGELIEGNMIRGAAEISWCGGTPGKGVASWVRRRWNSSPLVIVGAEDDAYHLTADDIDSSLVFMYTPVTKEGAKGEPQYAMTDFIKAAPPSVSNVRIFGDAVEGNTIKGIGEYFGGKEGPSKFEWLREDNETGNLVVVSSGASEYNLTKNDIGHRLVFIYIPANFEGQEGKSVSVVSEVVKRAPPKVTNLKIVGDVREGSKLAVTATVVGGTEGSSRVQWFKTSNRSAENEINMEAISSSKLAKTFRVPLAAVGYYIVAKFTPDSADGETGEPGFTISEKVVDSLPPTLNFLSVTGDYCEGEMLTATYGYIGGHEGTSLYNWYLQDTEGTGGVLIAEACGLLQCFLTKESIGKLISFECVPVRDDGIAGDPRPFLASVHVRSGSPRLLYLRIIGEGVEGTTLHVEKKYWGGEEGDSVFSWLRTSPNGTVSEIKGAKLASYKVSSDDIGFLVSVSCEPIRSDWTCGPTVISEHVGPIIPGPPSCQSLELFGSMIEGSRISFVASYSGGEKGCCLHEWFRLMENGTKEKLSCDDFLDLTLEDVGRFIELDYTPVRKDGFRGPKKSVISTVISAANPKGIELVIPDCCQDMEVIPQKTYFGGKQGIGEYVWYRTIVKPDESSLLETSSFVIDSFVVGRNLSYTPTIEDVGSYLVLTWIPTRDDGKQGSTVVAVSTNPVMAELPVVTDVHIKDLGTGTYVGQGLYYGGYEGSSMYSWYRQTAEGTILLIPEATSLNYKATDPDYNCHLYFGYTPVRSDSVVGELVMSEASSLVLPALPIVEMLYFNGKEVEGEIITAVEVTPQTEDQMHIWSNYKKEIKYQWFYSTRSGEKLCFALLPLQQSCSYRVRYEDIGCCLKCECTFTDVFGRTSEIVSAVTSPILPGTPRITKLEIEGRGFHTNLYAVRGIYNGGKEGKSRIQWLRSMVGSPDLISIPGEVGRMYEANVDDVGYRLVSVYTPIREDGVEGEPASTSTEPIVVEPDVLREVKEKLEIGSLKFEALMDKDKKVPGAGNLERRILEVNRKRIKVVKPGSKTSFPATEIRGTYAPPFHVELFRSDQHRFKIVVDSGEDVDLMVQTRHMRDIIVLVIRGLAQRYNSTSLDSLLKVDN